MRRDYRSMLMAGTAVLALFGAPLPASAGERPLSDFISRQETWCAAFTAEDSLDCSASHYGSCGPNEGSFSFPQYWTDPKTGITAGIDSLGLLDEEIFDGDLGTTVDGSVSESALPGGLADVKVTAHATNALTRAFDADGEPLFGYFAGEVLDGAPATLGDSFLRVQFRNTAPGAPLPDFNQLVLCPLPGQALEVVSMRARASGPLRAAFGVLEGTPGRMEVTQTGLIGASSIANPNSRLGIDAFPAEKVIIRATGK